MDLIRAGIYAPRPMPVQRDVTASGIRVRVSESGRGQTLLLLHGLFLDHSTWEPLCDALPGGLRLVAPDLPGFGASEKPTPGRYPYGIEALAEAVADLYAGLELGRASVVGQCLGGAVALELAARHPELVSRLVLVNPLCEAPRLGPYGRIALLPLVGGFTFKQLWTRAVFRAFFRDRLLAPDASVDAARIDAYYQTFSEPRARASALETLRSTFDTRGIVAKTRGVRAPTLVVWGSSDRVVPPRLGQKLAREIHGARFEVLDAGHALQEERPLELARSIRSFLA
jgi:pimeloyl-ACP methyl ester carboxylesterase